MNAEQLCQQAELLLNLAVKAMVEGNPVLESWYFQQMKWREAKLNQLGYNGEMASVIGELIPLD